jgi:hypothetical protein
MDGEASTGSAVAARGADGGGRGRGGVGGLGGGVAAESDDLVEALLELQAQAADLRGEGGLGARRVGM